MHTLDPDPAIALFAIPFRWDLHLLQQGGGECMQRLLSGGIFIFSNAFIFSDELGFWTLESDRRLGDKGAEVVVGSEVTNSGGFGSRGDIGYLKWRQLMNKYTLN
ncbi:hypothetical protein LINGRAHAP2_LOCUS30875 [Linum grandiflorum]